MLGPETLGAISYLSKFASHLKESVIAGFGLSCVGDNNGYSYVKTIEEDTIADMALESALIGYKNVISYPYTQRGSEERQFGSGSLELPYVEFSRSRAGEYPEYHTNKDDLNFVSSEGFSSSFAIFKDIIDSFELGCYPSRTSHGEPFLSKFGLYSTDGHTGCWSDELSSRMNRLAYSNGRRSIYEICLRCNIPLRLALIELKSLASKGLLKLSDTPLCPTDIN